MRKSMVVTIALLAAICVLPALTWIAASGPDPKADAPDPNNPRGDGQLNQSAVPFKPAIPWLIKAGAMCTEVGAPLLAAQLQQESGFNPKAVSPKGADGIAQFLPGTFGSIGKDDDGNGKASPYDVGDAIMAQGRFMCQLARQLKNIPGNPVANILAAYNAGPGAVQRYNGVPPYKETTDYIRVITSNIAKYTQIGTGGLGGCVMPANGPLGDGVGVPGPAWHWYGRHTGQDILAPYGAKIVASCAGKIIEKGSEADGNAYGNHIIIDLGTVPGLGRITMLYAHMSAFATPKVGDHVAAGQELGRVGATGNAFGPHLHLEVRKNFSPTGPFSQFLDPIKFIKDHSGPPADVGGSKTTSGSVVAAAIKAARSQLGVPYSWGGGGYTGPTRGKMQGAGTVGFDCSSLMQYAWFQATNGTVQLPRLTYDQLDAPGVKPVDYHDIQAGDLLFFRTGIEPGWGHVGMYLGNGQMIEAPHTGAQVRITDITSGYYAQVPHTARRITIKGQPKE